MAETGSGLATGWGAVLSASAAARRGSGWFRRRTYGSF